MEDKARENFGNWPFVLVGTYASDHSLFAIGYHNSDLASDWMTQVLSKHWAFNVSAIQLWSREDGLLRHWDRAAA